MMRNYNITAGIPAFAIEYFRSEDSEKGSIASDGSDVAEMYDDFVYTPTNGLLVLIGDRIMPSSTNVMRFLMPLQKKKQPDKQKLKTSSIRERPLSSVLIATSIW